MSIASSLDARSELDALVQRSRLLGADTDLVVHGGGNTSTKTREPDHLGRDRDVLRIKGSGTDLRSVDAGGFPGLYLDELLPLREREGMTDEEMVEYLARCMLDPSARRPSIETLLHAFIPARHVDHVHADAIVTLTNTGDGEHHVREALGPGVAYVPYIRPGFALSKLVAGLAGTEGVVLAHHGLVTWGETHEESVQRTLDLVARADEYLARRRGAAGATRQPPPVAALSPRDVEDLLLALRGRLSTERRRILHVDTSQREISDRADVGRVAAAGPATADHLLRTRTSSAVVRSAADAAGVLDTWEQRYRAYFAAQEQRLPAGYGMLEPLPSVALVPGLGAVACGHDKRSAQVIAEVALHTHRVAASAIDAFGDVERLSDEHTFDIDYWPMELYKLSLAPRPAELAGSIVIVSGAASGIGRAVAVDLAERGAHLVIFDLDGDGLEETRAAIGRPERVASIVGDGADDGVVAGVVSAAVRTFGGLDGIVANAGIPATGTLVELTPEQWRRSMEVNATAHFLLTRRAVEVLARQGLGGSLVYVASKNAFGPGAGFGAYSAAKAAQVQLARIAALEGGAHGIRANVVNPDAVFDGSKLWSPQVRAERAAAHGVAPDELEDFYARRNLLRSRVTTGDVAEAVAFLLGDRSARTTGCVITVDGGVAAAFPR